MTKARKSPKPAKASKPAKTNVSNETQAAKGRGRGGRGRGRAKAVTEPIEPIEPIEHVPNASGRGGRGRSKVKAVTKPIKPVEPEHAPIASGGGGCGRDRDRGHGKTNKPVESDVSTTIKDKTGHSGKSSPNVITVHDDDPIYDDPPDDFSTSELPERSQFGRNDYFTLDYSAILDESNEDNYELETTGASTNNIYDHSESSDEAEDGEDRKTEVSMSRDMPKALNGMENILEVCQWLITERQDILFMANQMVPPDEVIERLVTKIFNYDLYSSDAEEVICHSKRVLTDFCSKLNKKIDARVSEFKEKRIREELTTAPTRTEIEEFLSKEVVENILDRYLKGTDKTKVKNCGTMEKLVLFVREAFKIHYTKYNIKDIKKLDKITMKCKVPSRSGKNIASKFSLE
ncbi:hypothetical protein GLOIN_2v1844060 [Rhizophagus irregularis DAOM 181602=DAOM 197198]|uniref:Uncharacterized protein n=1 Tax=Rhizophagus irregularis (strain DAOM 181602 / DAOM 197198 / MUCL 43194) TaxID=747089 RepID=A0A2P4PMH6_RHIID|nr:hypothetical protein GLOIN_2v1844060 [Rhizophagus irregularis DAOM 181602=DAOM 197198]POG66596.1 hypothetical protein GLOIN_2v1844060 [Rhizophagus irregularis DAOM 181602=DAOM 197198]|eukprot:XP_025173462.1 hypothetical protein GLOIN_2v1844060 [Rhizophagus irregularis DAOM 181602=DAOM 197198]